jgi:hypothetical protein
MDVPGIFVIGRTTKRQKCFFSSWETDLDLNGVLAVSTIMTTAAVEAIVLVPVTVANSGGPSGWPMMSSGGRIGRWLCLTRAA